MSNEERQFKFSAIHTGIIPSSFSKKNQNDSVDKKKTESESVSQNTYKGVAHGSRERLRQHSLEISQQDQVNGNGNEWSDSMWVPRLPPTPRRGQMKLSDDTNSVSSFNSNDESLSDDSENDISSQTSNQDMPKQREIQSSIFNQLDRSHDTVNDSAFPHDRPPTPPRATSTEGSSHSPTSLKKMNSIFGYNSNGIRSASQDLAALAQNSPELSNSWMFVRHGDIPADTTATAQVQHSENLGSKPLSSSKPTDHLKHQSLHPSFPSSETSNDASTDEKTVTAHSSSFHTSSQVSNQTMDDAKIDTDNLKRHHFGASQLHISSDSDGTNPTAVHTNNSSNSPSDAATVAEPISDDVVHASQKESKHEIIYLTEKGMEVNSFNLNRFRDMAAHQNNTLVVSFLGDTSAGKSHTIRELMSESESRPFCQGNHSQSVATTFNVNLFPCFSLVEGVTMNFVDYEGENGSDTPIMAAARMVRPAVQQARHRAVVEHFPRLAYTTSDVIVVICREPFYNRRYLERCVAFAKRANAGVTNVDRPALLLIGNKLPGEECEADLDVSTNQFFDAWGDDAKVLDSYFSTVICMYMPHRGSLWRSPDGSIVDGSVVYEEQIAKLKRILHVLAERRIKRPKFGVRSTVSAAGTDLDDQRLITQHQGLWFALLPRVIRELNAGRGVNVSTLIDSTWAQAMAHTAAEHEMEMDIFVAFLAHLRPRRSLSFSAPRMNEDVIMRFITFRNLALSVAVRLIACRVRTLDPGVVVDAKVAEYARLMLGRVEDLLDEITPCVAVYDHDHIESTPVERPDEPVLCLQERRAHANDFHRTSRRVKVDSSARIWTRILNVLPYNDTWKGEFSPPSLPEIDLDGLEQQVLSLVKASDKSFIEALLPLQRAFSALHTSIGFVRNDIRHETNIATSELNRTDEFKSVDDAIVRSAGVDDDFCGPIDHQVANSLHTIQATFSDSGMPYCIGCGRKHVPQNDSVNTESPNESFERSRSWWRSALTVLGLLPSTANNDVKYGQDTKGSQYVDSESIEESLAAIEQELAESTHTSSTSTPNTPRHRGTSSFSSARKLANALSSTKSKDDTPQSRVKFSPPGGSPDAAQCTFKNSSQDIRGALRNSYEEIDAIPKQHVLLALCQRCWGTISSSRLP